MKAKKALKRLDRAYGLIEDVLLHYEAEDALEKKVLTGARSAVAKAKAVVSARLVAIAAPEPVKRKKTVTDESRRRAMAAERRRPGRATTGVIAKAASA